MRPYGQITDELEELLLEMYDEHEMQLGEVLHAVLGWTMIHYPGAVEEFEDGTKPTFYYGHEEKDG